ncbi:MAG: Chemotaxis protein CheA [Syntrophorhabdaceae bacterium PtaU1.Bin034]|nr:MAG: Chemotaxis protein CheA [Syntrophorhabdaceae bacterium PtaU1.Bin034]
MNGQGYDDSDLADFSMLELFRIEVENYTKLLEAGLVEVEQDQAPEKIEPLMRAAHSIKGAARLVGLDAVVGLAHAMEDVLSAAQHGKLVLTSGHIDVLLRGTDVFLALSKMEPSAVPDWLAKESEALGTLAQGVRDSMAAKKEEKEEKEEKKEASPRSARVSKKEAPGEKASAQPPQIKPAPDDLPGKRAEEKEEQGFVRVVSESLNRLMGYAGECLVQAKSVKPLAASLLRMKEGQTEVISALEDIFQSRKTRSFPREIQERFGGCLKELDRIRDLLVDQLVDFELFSRSLERLADKLYHEVVAIRMRPFSDGLPGFPRMVRDLAKNTGKEVNFRVLGESTRVDRDVLEKLKAPLTHLLRNAIDHGLETPDERQAAGKQAEGSITLEARHSAGMLNVRVTDDGKGIDIEKLRRKIVDKGHVSAEMAVDLTETELLDFLFLPGFSTAEKVTEVSGRGVGLDVVLSMVQGVGGSVRVETTQGSGTSFHLLLPLTLSVLRALLVEVSGEPYAVPLTRIDHIVEASHDRIKILEDKQFYTYGNEHVGIVDARQVLQLPSTNGQPSDLCIVIMSDRLNRYGLVVDRFLGQRELVVIPLDSRLGKIPNIGAGAILEDGSPALILDVDDLVRSIDNLLTRGRLQKIGEKKASAGILKKRILVVDDSLTVREVERRLLENKGYGVTVAVDGVDGWNALQLGSFDLIVSDIDMPRMNGIELIKKIKGDVKLKDIPVIIVSYKDREEDRLRGLEAGANYYLTKSSFHDEGLGNAVRDLIGEA